MTSYVIGLEQEEALPMANQNECEGCGVTYEVKKYNKTYCSVDCYWINGTRGDANHFYGKKHTEETLNKMRGDERLSHKGKDNPFYGKNHDEETKEIIREKNKIWRENNKELLLKKRLERKGLTKELLLEHWGIYETTPVNRNYFKDTLSVDYRTFQKFLIDCDLLTKEEIKKTTEIKQLFQHGSGVSAPEMKLFTLLVEEFGKDNVTHQSKRFGYWYDFCLFGCVLVEYDGYYYHKVLVNKNDQLKEDLALTNGYDFVRIEEGEDRLVDWDLALKSVREAVGERV